jgi:hypothetical protein
MAAGQRFSVEVVVTDEGIAGSVVDASGRRRPFAGWLELIALLAPAAVAEDDTRAART